MSRAKFITLPVSHYCEKSRWAMDAVGMPYQEIAQAPAFHRSLTRKYGGTTVPVLAHDGKNVHESAAINQYVDALVGGHQLYSQDSQQRAEIIALEEKFDADLGTSVRQWAYAFLINEPKLLRQVWAARVPFWQACLVPIIVPKAQKLIRKMYRITDNAAEQSLQQIDAIFCDVEHQLSDGRDFLVANQFSAADIAFAALAAPILLPSKCQATMPTIDQIPAPMRLIVEQYRARPAGLYAMNVYAKKRHLLN